MARTNNKIIIDDLEKQLGKNGMVERKIREFANDVQAYAKRRAAMDLDAGYATGDYIEGIELKRRPSKGLPRYRIAATDPKSHWIEYGTGADEDDDSPWGPYTPTPEYAIMAKTWLHFGGHRDVR